MVKKTQIQTLKYWTIAKAMSSTLKWLYEYLYEHIAFAATEQFACSQIFNFLCSSSFFFWHAGNWGRICRLPPCSSVSYLTPQRWPRSICAGRQDSALSKRQVAQHNVSCINRIDLLIPRGGKQVCHHRPTKLTKNIMTQTQYTKKKIPMPGWVIVRMNTVAITRLSIKDRYTKASARSSSTAIKDKCKYASYHHRCKDQNRVIKDKKNTLVSCL